MQELQLDANGTDRPLLSMISRMDGQKGFDLLVSIVDNIMATGADLVILGSGNEWVEKALEAARDRFPGRIALRYGFDGNLAHRIIAGADIFLMPSRYEPCGLTQMYAMKYGAIPVVRGTGGLEDTISPFDPATGEGNGLKFYPYDSKAFLNAVLQAVDIYSDPARWHQVMHNTMKMDFSWDRSAREYTDIYRSVQR